MDDKERSVVERLEDIENKIPTYKEPIPISKVIGMPFADYLNKSITYCIEEDERKFKKTIKKQFTMPIICISIILVSLIIHIVGLVTNGSNEWMLIVCDALAFLCPLMVILILANQKSKQPAKSFWNVRNKEFYLAKKGEYKQLKLETKNGFWFYAMLFGKIISIFGTFVLTLFYFFSGIDEIASSSLYWLSSIFGYLVVLTCVVVSKFGDPYYYRNYIFETDDSYVTYPDIEYIKK